MGAFGGRGILLAAAESGGFQLATRTDAMLTRTTSDKVAEMESAEMPTRTGCGWSWKARGASRGPKAGA